MDDSDYDEGLWDELNHQQSREIEAHHYRRDRARGSSSVTWLPPVIGSAIRQASQAVALGIAGNPNNSNINDQRYESLLPPPADEIDNDLGIQNYLLGGWRPPLQANSEREEPLLTGGNLYGSRFPEHQPPPPPDNNTNTNSGYVFLQPFRLLPRRDGWGAVADLDVFFNSLYHYYYHRGFTVLAMKGLVEIITLFFTLGLSIFLFAHLDWTALASCTEEETCRATFSDYIIAYPLTSPATSFGWKVWVFLYSVIFLFYGTFSAWSWMHALQQARASKQFMEEQLGIGERKLQSGAVDWDQDVVCKIQELQVTGQYRIAIHGQADETLDALLIAQRIMRKDNFMVALFNNPTLLDLGLPLVPGTVFFSKSLEWTIYFCVLNFMFNHKYQLRPAFYFDPAALKTRFFLCGVAHVIFMPFLLFFMTLYFALQNAYDWKSTKNYLGPRDWALAAKWTLREFNELPHLFERRMEPSYDAAEKYLKLFRQNEIITAMGRILVFVGGSLGAVLFAFAAMNDAILLHVKIADWNLLWFAGVFAAIYSTGKAMLPPQEKNKTARTYHANLAQEMDLALEQVAKHTHHFPDVWKGRGWDKRTTYRAFTRMYQYKARLFAQELVSIIVAPYLLCVSLPRCAERICDFILAIRAEVPGAGDMCGYSTFDFDTYGDELWEGRTLGRSVEGLQTPTESEPIEQPRVVPASLTESIMQSGNVPESTQQFPIPKAREGKMEKSFFSFKATHPSWKCNRSGQDLIDRLEEYQQEEHAAIERERQLHIEAAARQLEVLAQLEQQQQQQRSVQQGPVVVDTNAMDDAYIPKRPSTHTAADAGAGSARHFSRHGQKLPPVAEHQLMPANNRNQPPPFPQQPPVRTLGQTGRTVSNEQQMNNQEQRDENQPLPFAAPPRPQAVLLSRANQHSVSSSSLNNLAPPPSIFPPAQPGPNTMATEPRSADSMSNRVTSTHFAQLESLALSSELRRILNMSTLDPDVGSVLADSATLRPVSSAINLARSMHGLPTVEEEERIRAAERQYMLLERYHSRTLMAYRPQSQGHVHPSHERHNPMSVSVADGALRSGNLAEQSNVPHRPGSAQNDRLGNSMF